MHMLTEARHVRSAVATLAFAACLSASGTAAVARQPPNGYKDLDLADLIDLGKHYVRPVDPQRDPRTGFVVGAGTTPR